MTATTLRDQGIEDTLAADVAINRNYAEYVREAVDFYATIGRPITADDVRARIDRLYPGVEPHHPNVLPGVMQRLASAGRLVPLSWRESTRPQARGRVLRTWKPLPERSAA